MSDDFDYVPRILTEKPGKLWWIIAVCIFVGSLIGLGASNLFPPVYEAVFKVSAVVKLTGNPEITEYLVESSLMYMGDLVYQQPLLDKVIEVEKKKGIELTHQKLREISSVERQLNLTFLHVRWSDPQIASEIANTWGNLYFASLEEGAKQAVIAEELSQSMKQLEDCLLVIQTKNLGSPHCTLSKTELEKAIIVKTDEIATAQSHSLGLYNELRVGAYEEAIIPTSPIRMERGWLIAAGAVLGFIFGLILTEIVMIPKGKTAVQ